MYGLRTCRNRASAADDLAICISEKIASCMRAPPLALKIILGIFRSVARSNTRVTFSPTTLPIEPPMKPKWKAPIETSRPAMRPIPETNASVSVELREVALIRSLYFFESENCSGSVLSSPRSCSTNVSGSSTSSSRRRTGSGKCSSHFGQTSRFLSTSCL